MGEYYRRKGPEGGHQSVGALDRDRLDGREDVQAVRAVLERRRRRVLLAVVTEHGPVTTRDLAIQVAARIHDVAPSAVSAEQRRSIAISLHHVDVPKLVALGVLAVDDDVDRIRSGPKAEPVSRVLGAVSTGPDERDSSTVDGSG